MECQHRMYLDDVPDDELKPREPDSVIRGETVLRRSIGVSKIQHHLRRELYLETARLPKVCGDAFKGKYALHHLPMFSAIAHRYFFHAFKRLGRILRADDAGNAQFARNDCRMAICASPVCYNRACFPHRRNPIGVGHIGDKHFSGSELLEIVRALNDMRHSLTRIRACCLAKNKNFSAPFHSR